MFSIFMIECKKLLHRPRTYAGLIILLIIMTAMLIGLKCTKQFEHMKDMMGQDFIVAGNITNAAFLARSFLQGIYFLILPLAVCSVCGDLIASEAADGTLRTILTRPVSRISFILTKYAVCILSSFVFTLLIGVIAYGAGLIFLGGGSLFLIPEFRTGDGIWVLTEKTAVIRLLASYLLVALGMLAVGSISFMISAFLSNSNGAVFGAMGFFVISSIIGQIEYFKVLKPYLLTTYIDSWQNFFGRTLNTGDIIKSAAAILIYAIASFIIGIVIFERRDVLV